RPGKALDLGQTRTANSLTATPIRVRRLRNPALDRDPAWVKLSRQKLAGVTFAPGHISPIAELARQAFDQAAVQQYAHAAALMSQAVAAADGPAERGVLQEQLAVYQNFLDPAQAQQTLVGALRHNASLTRPLVGVKPTRIKPTDVQANLAAEFLARTYKDRNRFLLGVNALLDDLSYTPGREAAFEVALERLGRHLGFESQRPERTLGNGPDVLWALGELRYLVLEAKSGATADKIWRKDVEQLSHSMNWFRDTYDATCTATPVLLHQGNTLDRNATAPPGCRVVTSPKMTALCDAVRAAMRALAEGDSWMKAGPVGEQLSANHLTAPDVIDRYGVAPRTAP
ncbi:helicase, partial [Streptomyces sp. NPDC058284]